MTRAAGEITATRTRASEKAIRAALRAIQDAGLPVEKVCVNGGRVEIHCMQVEKGDAPPNDKGLEKW